jgi:hypothetical protein
MILVVGARGAERPAELAERVGCADDVVQLSLCSCSGVLVVDIRPQVVLKEVIGQRLTAVRRAVGVAGRIRLRVELVSLGELQSRVLARVEETAAFVEVGPHGEHLVVGEARNGAGHHPGLSRDDVVARVPDDRVVVGKDSERARGLTAVRVDVVDVGAVPLERIIAPVKVEQTSASGRERRALRRPQPADGSFCQRTNRLPPVSVHFANRLPRPNRPGDHAWISGCSGPGVTGRDQRDQAKGINMAGSTRLAVCDQLSSASARANRRHGCVGLIKEGVLARADGDDSRGERWLPRESATYFEQRT